MARSGGGDGFLLRAGLRFALGDEED